jgi:hypothetical protein
VYLGLLVLSTAQLVVGLRVRLVADTAYPVTSVLWLLTLMIAAPFITLSISSPLFQSWYARSRAGTDKAYRLYAVSNVGSLLALVAYPWLLEPHANLSFQMLLVASGIVVLFGVCAAIARGLHEVAAIASPASVSDPRPSLRVMAMWIALAGCGSLLLAGVTNHLTRNVAAIPLLWVAPLIAYLLSFVVAFSDHRWHSRLGALALGVTGLGMAGYRMYRGDLGVPVAIAVSIHCSALFGICVFCHTELYRRRPATSRLTVFYFCLAVGGALGAMLVGIAAPLLLNGEYEFMIGLALTAAVGGLAVWDFGLLTRIAAVAVVVWFGSMLRRDVRNARINTIYRERNFYGALQVTEQESFIYRAQLRRLMNGIIEHGEQVYRVDLDTVPTTYYSRSSGVGLAVELCCVAGPRRIGVIGLGTGTMAAYGREGDVVRFYDINPAVEPIARRGFTYLAKSKARVEVVTGDARLSLESEPSQNYDVLAVDAFSGDAIPVHLITSEALAVYLRHLSSRGAVAFHVSNRYLALAPVVKQLADHAGMSAVLISTPEDPRHDGFSSDWVVLTKDQALAAALRLSKDREEIVVPPGLRLWTDDYNSLLPILKKKWRTD